MYLSRLAAVLLALGAAACASREPPPAPATTRVDLQAEAAVRGHDLAARTCAGCHAIGPVGASPMPEATPFRVIVRRRSLDQLEQGFGEGLVTSHPAMPAFTFRASEIDDLIAWLETVRSEP
jgi:mono/diheme cytochrome c family protein